jgi:excisionase family DNA binding protein
MKTYTTVELAQRLGVARATIYRWLQEGKIENGKVIEIGPVKVRQWTDRDVARIRKFMKECYWRRKKSAKE